AWCLHHEQQELQRSAPGRVVPLRPITLINTRDVDLLLWRRDLDRAVAALGRAGFSYDRAGFVHMFLRRSHPPDDRRQGARRGRAEGIHLLFAGEGAADRLEAPAPEEATEFTDTFWETDHSFRVINLVPLVRMKLSSVSGQRLKDLVHVVELWESGA